MASGVIRNIKITSASEYLTNKLMMNIECGFPFFCSSMMELERT
jgi:hypothetical protein